MSNSKPTFYLSSGTEGAPVILFLHGLFDRSRTWVRIMNGLEHNFEKKYHCIALDLKGHGFSPSHPGGYEVSDLAQHVYDISQDILKISGPVIVVGHSLGSKVAVDLAHSHPEFVQALFLEDFVTKLSCVPRLRSVYRSLVGAPTPCSYDELLAYCETQTLEVENFLDFSKKAAVSFFLLQYKKREDGLWDWVSESMKPSMGHIIDALEFYDSSVIWKELSQPTFLLRGQHSQVLSASEFDLQLSQHSHSMGAVMPEVGHGCHFGNPSLFSFHLKNFLKTF